MGDIYEKAVSAFDSGWYCGESVLLTIAKEMSIESPLIPAIATGFCSGMSRSCGMCGAVSGGILALNILYGRQSKEESIDRNYEAVQRLLRTFEKEFSSTNCRQLLDCDLSAPEGQQQFEKKKLWKKCHLYTGRAAEITRGIIADLDDC